MVPARTLPTRLVLASYILEFDLFIFVILHYYLTQLWFAFYFSQVGDTPLYEAAHCGKLDVVKLLLTVGGDINYKNKDGKSVLDGAKGNVLRYLLEDSAEAGGGAFYLYKSVLHI